MFQCTHCMDWLSAKQNGRRAAESFRTMRALNPISPNAMRLAKITKSWVHLELSKKTIYDSSYLATLNLLFACRFVVLGFLKLNVNAKQPDKIHMLWHSTYIGIRIFLTGEL